MRDLDGPRKCLVKYKRLIINYNQLIFCDLNFMMKCFVNSSLIKRIKFKIQ